MHHHTVAEPNVRPDLRLRCKLDVDRRAAPDAEPWTNHDAVLVAAEHRARFQHGRAGHAHLANHKGIIRQSDVRAHLRQVLQVREKRHQPVLPSASGGAKSGNGNHPASQRSVQD